MKHGELEKVRIFYRIEKVFEYVSSNSGCRRQNIQAYMNNVYKCALSEKTVSDYLRVLIDYGDVEMKNGQFFIIEQGRKSLAEKEGKV